MEELMAQYLEVRDPSIYPLSTLDEIREVLSKGETRGLPLDELVMGYLRACVFACTTSMEERERIAKGAQREYGERQRKLIAKVKGWF